MRKITLMAALLGSAYFANAQVGIGTPAPVTSAMLDITADDKGVLIPRVNLSELTVFEPINGTQENGLLVFATGKKYTSATDKTLINSDVTTGFYYWNVNKWERIVNQTQLDQVISNQGDIAKVKALLDAAYGSNNLGETPTTGSFGGMVYTPADGATPAKIEYVKWNPALNGNQGGYEKLDATAGLISLIQGNETKTKIETIEGKQFYFAENYVGAVPTTIPSPLPAGMYLIDVVGGVVNNIEEIFTTQTTIVINEGELNQQTFETVQEYIEYIISESNQPVGSMTFTQGTGTTTADKLASSSFTYILADGTVSPPITFSDLVKANETNTTLTKSNGAITAPIVYTYSNENVIKGVAGATATEITITADIISSITSNTDVQNAIKNLVSQGNNVGYTVTAIAAGANNGVKNGVAIPANSFYYVDADGLKNVIDLANVVVNATTINADSTPEQINNVTKIKQNLGDAIVNNTSVFTGDTITISGVTYYIYKGNFPTTVNAGEATTTGTSIDKEVFKILSMQLSYAGGVSANVTDMVLSGTDNKTVAFNVGTGKMYTVLGTSDIVAEVIIEFASPVSPILVP